MSTGRRWRVARSTQECLQCTLTVCEDDNAVDCNIFHCPTNEVEIEGLPASWPMYGAEYNTLTLPCGHTYHPSALALHFLISDMRCPVCRRGYDGSMHLCNIPKTLRPAFQRKCEGVASREDSEESLIDLLQMISFDLSELERDFRLVVDISVNMQSRLLLQTPIAAFSPNSHGSFVPFRTQQSFQRILNKHLTRFQDHADATITFSLQHPIMYLPIQTERSNLSLLISSTSSAKAIPFSVQDGDEGEGVVAALILSPSPDNPTPTSHGENSRHMGLYINRERIFELCVAAIHSHLNQLVQQA